MTSSPSALLIGISGLSSSGKTTLARLLRDILTPHAFILHEDDFYKTDADIPVHDGVQDWDCLESIDLELFTQTLKHVKEHGRLPAEFVSKEDKNEVGESGIPEKVVESCRRRLQVLLNGEGGEGTARKWRTPIAIVDGFLLYPHSMRPVSELLDLKLFLRTSCETAKRRREARSGYVTLEGFWEDPPGYMDKVVWPNYVKDHKLLFRQEDVNSELDEEVCRQMGIAGMPRETEGVMSGVLDWAVEVVESCIKERMGKERSGD